MMALGCAQLNALNKMLNTLCSSENNKSQVAGLKEEKGCRAVTDNIYLKISCVGPKMANSGNCTTQTLSLHDIKREFKNGNLSLAFSYMFKRK